MVYSSFSIDTDDDRELEEQAELVQEQSEQEERDTEEEIEQEVEEEIEQEVEEESNNDSEECEEVVSATELSEVEVSSSIKLQTSGKPVKCFLFDLTKKDDFLNWWMTSKWFYNNEEKSKRKKKKISWGSEKKALHWKQFFEGATVVEGTPKVVCKRCTVVLSHPGTGVGNSTMVNHLNSVKCKKTSKTKGLKRLPLNLGYRATVKGLS
jgi:hypothetical protein